jgi:hypothetical protein
VAEAITTQAIEAARQAAAAAQAAANTDTELCQDLEWQPREPSRSLERRRRIPSPSPERRRERGGHHGSPAAVQTVYKDSGAGTLWSMLTNTKTNYHEWSSLMKVKMQARQLWDAIKFADLPYHEDRRALEAIIVGVPSEMGALLADKASAKEV